MTEDVRTVPNDASDVIEFLLDQHQQVRGLLDDVMSSSGEERQRYFDTVREMLARHETAEEMIVRPLTRKAPGGEQVAEGRMEEENEAKEVLAELEKMDVDSADFTAKFQQFRQSVLDHAAAEERDEFPLLRQNCDPDALMSARDRVKRAEAMAPTHPHPSAKTTAANYVAGPFAAMLDRARDAFSSSGTSGS
jgi:hemerythrin superfamily protein